MSGLSSALNIGSTGLSSNQKGIEVSGNNVANANTLGYSKQTLELSSTPTLQFNGQMIGQGTVVSNITREGNSFVTKQLISKNADYGESEAKTIPLAEVERIVGIDDSSIANDIDEFFDAWQELSTDPSGDLQRQQVMQMGEMLANNFQGMVSDLDEAMQGIDESLEGNMVNLNRQLEELADLNVQIASAESTGISSNALRDQRELLLQEVSESAGITYYEEANGMVSVQLASGLPLVTADVVSTISTSGMSGSLQFTLTNGSMTTSLDSTDFGGEIHGLLDLRDNYIPALKDDLDLLAYELAEAVNGVHTGGVDANGDSGVDFFSYSSTGSDPWSGAASTLSMNLTTTSQVAAGTIASPDHQPGDNSNTLNMVALQSQTLVNGTSTFTEYYAKIAADVGLEVSQNDLTLASAEDALVQMQNMRDAIAGVSIDEEMLLLTQYQTGYEAAAKYLSTVDEMLDTLMSM
ncbi:flagellar hook-associated protein 1 FlgK [Desulfuromusa kysingii]|uniref:Flagellar hook-associated protein 1 n=1 Tax=Desulfuromusa kysingii TaxID=37625 RepID=A0A1H3W109_9BACT|nr:flagellar hook-associated protein FlgK [Desulfuromusa kysingii]SDZ80008.1 flagellar hook-associated protein 1 FlgK [Desulfuromusa kysingii]